MALLIVSLEDIEPRKSLVSQTVSIIGNVIGLEIIKILSISCSY